MDTNQILRFCAGVLYKYSLTTKDYGRIELNRYQEVLRMFLFDKNAITPDELDAFVFRPLTYPSDNGVFAYRAPKPDKQYGANIYRMMMGGLMFFIKLDRRSFPEGAVSKILMKNANGLPYLTTPVVGLEEFEMARESFQKNQGLSEYLDKNP